MRSLYWKLSGALLLVVLISVGVMAYVVNVGTTREFRSYVQQGATFFVRSVADNLAQYYDVNRSWSGVDDFLNSLLRSSNDRLVVVDNSGVIVADTGKTWVGRKSAEVGLTNSTPVVSNGQPEGSVFLLTTGGTGMGMMGGRGPGAGAGQGQMMLTTPEQDFQSGIFRYLLIAGLIAAAAAILLGLLLTRQILKPVKALTAGASRIARGELNYRTQVKSRDEIGVLASSFNTMALGLERSEESRRRLNADIAHELRTPLTIIEGTVDGILDGVFQPDKFRLNAIKEQTALLTRLINDLRVLSTAESGQLKLELKPADLVDLVRRKFNQVEPQAKARGIQLEVISPAVTLKARVDSSRLEQVLANLNNNALRHTSPGGKITATVKAVPEAKSVIISIRDTGEGIPAESLPHIFERFYSVDGARSRSDGGTGLGLAIVKQMVEAHSGSVRVESEQGKGTAFFITLPLT